MKILATMSAGRSRTHSRNYLRAITRNVFHLFVFGVVLTLPAIWNEAKGAEIEEIVVTATKRGETSLQYVPVSITVVTEAKIELAEMDDLVDYARTIPNIGFQVPSPAGGRDDLRGGRRISIRGVESGPDGVPTTAFYMDDAPVPVMDPKLFDVNRIEVLRGPQGTLYGANSMGGTIRIIMNKPDLDNLDWKGDVTALATPDSGDGTFRLNGMLNVPLVEDKFALRGVVSHRDEGGYIDNVRNTFPQAQDVDVDRAINSESSWGMRLSGLWQPTDNLEIVPSVFHQETRVNGKPEFEPKFGDLQYFNQQVDTQDDNVFTLYNVELNYDFGNWSLFSSTAVFDSKYQSIDDFTKLFVRIAGGSLFPDIRPWSRGLQDIRSERRSEEIRLSYANQKVSAVFGLFFMDDERSFEQELPTEGNWSTFPPPETMFTGFEVVESENRAAFGEVTYFVTDGLEVTAGARWYEAETRMNSVFDGVLNGGLASSEGSHSESDVSPKVGVKYKLNDSNMVFATAAKGFRPGGPTNIVPPSCDQDLANLGISPPVTQYVSDSLWSYELGVKSSFASDTAQVNASAYFIDWTDVQQAIRLPICGFGFVGNAGAAETQGFEVELSLAPTDRWDIYVGVGHTTAEFTKSGPGIGVDVGDELPNVPEWTGSLSGQYRFPIKGRNAFVRLDGVYVGEAGSFGPGDDVLARPEYTLFNAKLGIDLTEKLSISFFAENILDERPWLRVTQRDSQMRHDFNVVTSRPRSFGVRLHYRAIDQ